MNTNIIDIAEEAKKILSSPEKHCTEVPARDASGKEVLVGSPEACRFCYYGAAHRAAINLGFEKQYIDNSMIGGDFYKASGAAAKRLGYYTEGVSIINDNPDYGYPHVIKIYDEVIRFEKEGK